MQMDYEYAPTRKNNLLDVFNIYTGLWLNCRYTGAYNTQELMLE